MAPVQRNPWTGFWEKVPEPRWASVWQTATYAAIAAGGVAGLIDPPTSIATQVSVWMMTYWAGLLAVGGACDDLDVAVSLGQGDESAAQQRLVLGDDHPDHGRPSTGRLAVTTKPPSGVGSEVTSRMRPSWQGRT